jgi:hypothetical protein
VLTAGASPAREPPWRRPRQLAWAELMRRVFATDVLECPRCGGYSTAAESASEKVAIPVFVK